MRPFAHFRTITRHKWLVLKHCFRVGLYWQGLTHDLSKYSPVEFWTGARYYQGNRSPNEVERLEKGAVPPPQPAAARQSAPPAASAAAAVPAAVPSQPKEDCIPWEEPPLHPVPVEPEMPREESVPAPAAPGSGSSDLWDQLLDAYKSRLPAMYRAFLDMCTGTLEGDLLIVYAPDEITLSRLDNDRVRGALIQEAAAGGVSVRVVFRVGEPPQTAPASNFEKLLKFGSQFDNIEIK